MIDAYILESREILLAVEGIGNMVDELRALRKRGGRLWILGLGGSSATASHAAADFRRLCNIEAYAPTDSTPEITALANDAGWGEIFPLLWSGPGDAVLILSVGGGTTETSPGLVNAIDRALAVGMLVLGIVGRDGGYTASRGHSVIVIPNRYPGRVTFHVEGLTSVILHCLVDALQQRLTKW